MSRGIITKMIDFNKDKYDRYLNRMQILNNQLVSIINEIATTTQTSSAYYSIMTKNIKIIYEQMRSISVIFGNMELPDVYKKTMQEEFRHIKSLKFKAPIDPDGIKTVLNADRTKQSINAIGRDFGEVMTIGLDSGQKTILRLLNVTQQTLIEEAKINTLVEKGFMEKGSVWGAKKKLQKELLKKSLDGKTVTVINKNGKPMSFDAKYYAEMVARTKLIEAQAIATVDTALQFGSDLVQVSSHNTPTPICQEFEGKIYSISGKDKDFPPLTEIPPFHPNCRHTLTVTFREYLERDGIQKYSDFSLGKTETHPTRKSHIPISERKSA